MSNGPIIEVSHDVFRQIKVKRVQIFEKYGKKVTIKKITETLILANIDRLEVLLGLEEDELEE